MLLNRPDSDIHYELSGDEDAPLIMFANSLGTDLTVWDELLPYLQGYRFLRYDKPGHGKSTVKGEFGMQDLVHDAIALIEEVGGKDVIFVGLSIGGMIGQGVCAERPDLVRGFVLMDSAVKIGTEDFWSERIAQIRAHGIASISGALMERWFTKSFIQEGKAEKWQRMVESTSEAGYIGCCNAIAHTDLYVSTANLRVPTLAIAGSEDGSTPPDMVRETAALIDNSSFKIIRKAGHIPCVEQPEMTAKLIHEFLEGLQ